MRIGIPREIKPMEGRVAMIPEACGQLLRAGHDVILERGAGVLSGYGDERYAELGVELVDGPPRTSFSK
jgi:alanine dehydrogenase